MRRRGVGLQALDRQAKAKEQYRQAGSALAQSQLQQLQEQLELFKVNLTEFAGKYRKDIRRDPAFRMHFQAMCTKIGVDPLACTIVINLGSNKGFWAELLGVGDFYYELAVQIIDVCLATRSQNGGLMDLAELKRHIERMRNANLRTGANQQEISEDDLQRAIRSLKSFGGFDVVSIGQRKLVQSVPRELSVDHGAILSLAQGNGNRVTKRLVKDRLQWDADRIQSVLDQLLRDGIVWVDTQADPHEFWVASFCTLS